MPRPSTLSEKELLARLAFWRTPNVGPKNFTLCLEKYSSLVNAFENINDMPKALAKFLQEANFERAEKDLCWLEAAENHLLILGEENYPKALAEISSAPPFLFVKGNPDILHATQIAMVGSRNPTHYGKQVATRLATDLAEAGLIITSGLALGIDAICHQATLQTNAQTIGVLAIGLDQVYPKRHQSLAEQIVRKGGALVSEFGVQTKALAENFPRRNRLISGLSLGVVVVEAGIKSGSLITARYASEQGRDVFAIPGSIFQPLSQGCHALIKQGAICTESISDILPEYAHLFPSPSNATKTSAPTSLNEEEKIVLNLLHAIPQSLDELLAQLNWPSQHVQSTLTQLCLKECVSQSWYGFVRI